MSYGDEITNGEDIINSHDIIERIEYLQSILDTTEEEAEDGYNNQLDPDESKELKFLKELRDEAEYYCPDWKYGAGLIRDSYFTEYTEDLIKDCYNFSTPDFVYIDWERTAKDVKMDYTTVNFNGVDYNVR